MCCQGERNQMNKRDGGVWRLRPWWERKNLDFPYVEMEGAETDECVPPNFFYPPLVVGGKGIKTQVTRLIIVLVFRRFSLCYNVFHFSSILCLVFCGIDCRSNCIFQTWWRSNWILRRHDSSAFRYAAVERVSIHFKTRQGKYFFNQVRQFPHIHVIM